ncbi:MAG: HDOD domain-containing protein [Mariprofundaceae bacterium]
MPYLLSPSIRRLKLGAFTTLIGHMDSQLQEKLTALVDQMPPFPKSVHRIIELAGDMNCAPKDLVQVIEHDPVITVKLLKLVNSAYFSLAKSISSIRHALVYLGLNTVKNLALSIATVDSLPRKNLSFFNTNQFLLHSLTTASIAQSLAKEYDPDGDAAEVFVAGLLHDFGKVVLAQFMSEEFEKAIQLAQEKNISLHLAEKEVIGADHTEVGAMLVEKWQLPDELGIFIRQHHDLTGGDGMADCIFAANQISKTLGFGTSGNPVIEALPASVAGRFGGKDLETLIESMGDLSAEEEKAKSFIYM